MAILLLTVANGEVSVVRRKG